MTNCYYLPFPCHGRALTVHLTNAQWFYSSRGDAGWGNSSYYKTYQITIRHLLCFKFRIVHQSELWEFRMKGWLKEEILQVHLRCLVFFEFPIFCRLLILAILLTFQQNLLQKLSICYELRWRSLFLNQTEWWLLTQSLDTTSKAE